MPKARTNLRGVTALVASRTDFDCNGTLSAQTYYTCSGRLPSAYHAEISRDSDALDFYVVYSYQTPIAWYANGVWKVPNVRYSAATARHMRALALVHDGSVWRQPTGERAWAFIGQVA